MSIPDTAIEVIFGLCPTPSFYQALSLLNKQWNEISKRYTQKMVARFSRAFAYSDRFIQYDISVVCFFIVHEENGEVRKGKLHGQQVAKSQYRRVGGSGSPCVVMTREWNNGKLNGTEVTWETNAFCFRQTPGKFVGYSSIYEYALDELAELRKWGVPREGSGKEGKKEDDKEDNKDTKIDKEEEETNEGKEVFKKRKIEQKKEEGEDVEKEGEGEGEGEDEDREERLAVGVRMGERGWKEGELLYTQLHGYGRDVLEDQLCGMKSIELCDSVFDYLDVRWNPENHIDLDHNLLRVEGLTEDEIKAKFETTGRIDV